MSNLLQDVRVALRRLHRSPGFAIVTILTLAIGIGATVAIFSLVNTILLRPLPFPEQDRLMWVAEQIHRPGVTNEEGEAAAPLDYPDFFDWRTQNHSFESLSSYHSNTFTLTGRGDAKHLEGQTVSADFFRTLGVNPALGRTFGADDEKPGIHVAMLSHQLWETAFGSSPKVVGSAITLDNKSYTVVGVMPKGFQFPIQTPAPLLWTSLADDAYDPTGDIPATKQRGAHMMDLIGRLKPGASAAQARADLALIARNLSAQYPDTNKRFNGAVVKPELEHLVGDNRPALRILFAAVTFVLLIACANVAGLLLARASRRRSEVAVRAALGATRPQIVREVMVEAVVLGIIGGALGVLLSTTLLRVLLHLMPENLPRMEQVTVDGTVLLFASLISIASGLLFGVLPAWRIARLDPSTALREGTRTASVGRGHHRVQNGLVIAETAIGLVLLVAAGLLIRSFVHVMQVDPGFNRNRVLTASLALPDASYSSQQQVQFYQRLLPRLQALPGVQSASAGWPLPLSQSGMRISFDIEGHPLPPGERNSERVAVAEPGYFATLQIPLLRGRDFTLSDDTKAPPVVAISESFARKYFAGEDPIGRHITPELSDGTVKNVPRQIVAVVGDIKARSLTADVQPEYYLPFAQAVVAPPTLALRTSGDPAGLSSALRAVVAEMDRNVPLYQVQTLDDVVSRSAAEPRFQTLLLGSFALVAVLLAAIGLYGLLSYIVVQRTVEIGVRIALGAQRGSVLGMIMKRGLTLAAIGLIVGVAASLVLTRFITRMLFGVRPLDPLTFVGVSAVLLLAALIASSAPAYRAATLDPMKTLRDQ